MKLTVLIPTKVLLVTTVEQVNGEAKDGAFGLLPNHIDFVTALTPGILSYRSSSGEEFFLAVDEGILVKCGQEVLVSTERAIQNTDLATLHSLVEAEFRHLDEQQKLTRTAIAKLEVGLTRGILQIAGDTHETT